MTLLDLKQKRTEVIAAMRQLLDKASAEKRELTSEEDANYTRMDNDLNAIDKNIDRQERVASLERENREIPNPTRMESSPTEKRGVEPSTITRKAGGVLVHHGARAVSPEEMRAYRAFLLRGAANELTEQERRALQMDSSTAGGYWVLPQMAANELLMAVDDILYMRQLSTVHRVPNAESLGIPSIDAKPSDSSWTSEILTGSADSTMTAGKRELRPHPLAKSLLVSNKLLRASFLNVDAIVRERLAYAVYLPCEKAYLTGTGVNQPLGIFTASYMGIGTARDVSTGNSTTAIAADGLINAKYSLKAQYQQSPSLRWIFHRDAVKMIRKLKDGDGQYLWRPGIGQDAGDTILGVPFLMSENAPNTFTTGLYVGLIGDLRFYHIADALDMQVQVVVELYAAYNQTGYFVRMETDGMPVLAEAFARVTLA